MDNNQKRLNFLKESLERVNSWLHFVEAKNAALAAFQVALLAALPGSGQFCRYDKLFSLIMLALLAAAAVVLWSFKPINHTMTKPKRGDVHPDLLHYAYIASLDTGEYLRLLNTDYWQDNTPPQRLELDYAEEIIQNARITLWKQMLFKITFYIDFVTILIICIFLIVRILVPH